MRLLWFKAWTWPRYIGEIKANPIDNSCNGKLGTLNPEKAKLPKATLLSYIQQFDFSFSS